MKPIILFFLLQLSLNSVAQEKQLEIEGAIKIGDLDEESPDPQEAGTIRWNPTSQDFEGWDGTEWKSLTMSSSSQSGPSSWVLPTTELCRLTAVDGTSLDHFGGWVDIENGVAVVGAPQHNTNGNNNQGKAYIFERNGECWQQVSELTALGGEANDQFGFSVAISGDVVIVGAPYHAIDGNLNQGKAYIYVKPATGWPITMTQTTTLISNDGRAEDQLGFSVNIFNDVAVVGARYHDIGENLDQGKAYIFEKPVTGWPSTMTQTATLIPNNGTTEDNFGISVSIFEDLVAIGATKNINDNIQQGIVYIFEKPATGWSSTIHQSASLVSSDGEAEDYFGVALSISGSTVVVGSPGKDINGKELHGKVYIYEKPQSGWVGSITEVGTLFPSDGLEDNLFGYSVEVYNEIIVVGAPWHDTNGNSNQGKTYIFEKPPQGWLSTSYESVTLKASDVAADDQFGINVAIDGNVVVVGAHDHDVNGNRKQGQAYIFVRNGLPSSN